MIALILILGALALAAFGGALKAPSRGPRPFARTGRHFRRAYSRRGFLRLGLGGGVAALLANTPVDAAVDAWHRDTVRSPTTDRLARVFREGGERYWFLYWLLFALGDGLLGRTVLTRWGRSAVEAMVVGLPGLWTVQRVAGASRPTDDPGDSRWRPMADDNSASGHTFMSSIPWIVAARRSGGAPARLAAYLASVAAGWSRINDRKHYLSQVIWGYVIAWNAVDAVLDEDEPGGSGHDSGSGPTA